MTIKQALTTSFAAAQVIILPTIVTGATLHVGTGQTYATIQAAVNASSSGDSIVVHDGTYTENVMVTHRLAIVSQDFLDNGENDGAILDAGSNYLTGLWISWSNRTTVEGLSFTGAFVPAYAIYVDNSNDCRIANNRIGWDEAHANGTALSLYSSNGCLVENNLVAWAYNSGIYVDQSSQCLIRENTFHDVQAPLAEAIQFSGLYDVSIENSNCRQNIVTNNSFVNNGVGVYASGYVHSNVIRNNDFVNNYNGIFLGTGGVWYHIVSQNTITGGIRNLVLDGASFNTIVDNVFDNSGTGIRIGHTSPPSGNYNIIGWNTITNQAGVGIYIGIAAIDNFFFLNHFAGNAQNVESHGTDWNTPTVLSYFYGPNHRNHLGNYYDSYTGIDTDGDGIGDTGLPFTDGDPTTGPVENYPLVSPANQYDIEAWYLEADSLHTMYHRDRGRPVYDLDMAGSEQIVWTSSQTASGTVNYPNGTWTGCISFQAPPSPDDFTVEIGSSSNGTDFSASGAQASIGGFTSNMFETSAAAVSVPDGHYLAVRLTNNTEWSQKLMMGGLMCYISSTGDDDPEWPGPASAVGPVTAVRLTLRQNYPNPFNPKTTIDFAVPERTHATVRIFDVSGHLVATLLSRTVDPGPQQVHWDGRTNSGGGASSGIYFYRLQAGNESITRKMVLLR